MFRVLVLSSIFFCTTDLAEAKDVYVNYYICERVEYKIKYVREEQRKANKVRRAEFLNRELRKYRRQLATCKEEGFLER